MTQREWAKLDTILAKIETLQIETRDSKAKERLQAAKSELLRLVP